MNPEGDLQANAQVRVKKIQFVPALCQDRPLDTWLLASDNDSDGGLNGKLFPGLAARSKFPGSKQKGCRDFIRWCGGDVSLSCRLFEMESYTLISNRYQ